MRVLRSLFLLAGVAIAAAGCTRPVAYMAYPTGGVDNVVYGAGAPYAPAAGVPSYAAPSYAGPTYPAAPAYAAAPTYAGAQTYAAASVAAPPPTAAPTPVAAPTYSGLYAYSGYATAPVESGYLLDAGDRLRVVVFGQDGLTNSYFVDASGNIDMPLIGPVQARGLTTDQLAARIAGRLREGFIREPHVAVEIEAYRPFFILGEVTQPGQYPYVANMTVETAVAIAGGFTPRAFRRNVNVDRNYYGRTVRITVPPTFPLRPGDTVYVQERWF